GDGTFEDVTEESGVAVLDSTACALFADFENKGLQDLLVVCGSGPLLFLNQGNGKFSLKRDAFQFAQSPQGVFTHAAIADYDADGFPDLYVANDFGRNNLYRNNGDGTFTCVSAEAGVEDVGAGMSASWCDFDNDGRPDLYTAAMWSAAGIRVSQHERFHEREPENIRALYRQHARGNSLYRSLGNGKFQNVSSAAGVEMGRWAWCSDAWDFDHDGYSDIYIANGYISAPETSQRDPADLSSIFWRQLVAKSPPNQTPSLKYEQGWNAINELIRSDSSWNGHERNVFYVNNRDNTFSEVSGAVGMDSLEDGRSFALADLDQDGRLEVVLKNR